MHRGGIVELDRQGLRSLVALRDRIGVLSVYLSVDERQAGAQAAAEAQVRRDLENLVDDARHDGQPERAKAVAAAVSSLSMEISRLLTTAGGQGKALFAPVSQDHWHMVSVQRPLVNRAVLGPTTYVRPLVAAWSLDGPAGVVVVSAEGVRAIDLRFGFAEEAARFGYFDEAQRQPLKGPAPGSSVVSSVAQTDLFANRQRFRLSRFLTSLGGPVSDLAASRGWEFMALAGKAELVAPLAAGLPQAWPVIVFRVSHVFGTATPHEIGQAVQPDLDRARQAHAGQLAAKARDAALSGGRGTVGLSETLVALQQGEVAHLLVDETRTWQGHTTVDGYLVPAGEVPPGIDEAALIAEPDLAERMIERAFATTAEVTLADPLAAAPLAEAGGVGALLRW